MTETTETRSREQVETELERAQQARDGIQHELQETGEKLEEARRKEAEGFAEAAAAGRKLTSGKAVRDLEGKRAEINRKLPAVGRLLAELELERDGLDLADLQQEAREAGEYAAKTLEESRRAREENERATAQAEGLRDEVRRLQSSLRQRRKRLDAGPPQPEPERPSWRPQVRGLNG